jgi:outer membrane protein OmpA-like peptidoglycan-associated protein
MKPIISLIIIACAGVLVGCAPSIPPTELINARQAYQHASAGQAAQLVPAELHKAQEALAIAEKSFQDDPKSFRTRDLAYIADRKAKMAEAFATTAAGNAATARANKDYQVAQTEIMKNTKQDLATQTEIVKNTKQDLATQTEISKNTKQDLATQTEIAKNTKEDLAASERSSAVKTEQLASEQRARIDAENRAAVAQADLVKLAAVKEEARGLVITLSGSVLFASNKSELLPSAQNRLNQVADALMATKERKLTVEGHTDSQGSSSYNQELSQRRADVVRSYIISRGYTSNLIEAHGIGKDRPVADNASAEGRANNRRVEIIVDHAANYQQSVNK